ncbi:uncharacterized protein LOC134791577 [Cydia splendana]|uniref:uncharacterized protein LOC134791577 n=1 Tax=Cydia splendana TaxID=1100963 RepID=UPI00300D5788
MVFSKIQMSDSATMKLIKEVQKHGSIWNPEDENYSDRQHLLVAWDEIAKALDMPEDIIRGKWKILRDFFKREVKRKNVTSVEEYKGRWRYFNSLGYLLHLSLPRAEEEDERTSEKVDVEIEYEPKYAPNSNLEVYLEDPIPEKRFKPNDSEDYDLMFLKSLTPFFKQLEPTRNLVVRSRIQDMLLNEIAAQNMNRNKIIFLHNNYKICLYACCTTRQRRVCRAAPLRPRRQLSRPRRAIDMASKIQMSDSDTLRLIKEMKKHGCIWNPDDDNYGDRTLLSVAWADAAKTLDMPEDIIRVKWKNLRDFFKKEVKKNDCHSKDDYGGRWRYFKSLGFLLRPEEEEDEQTDSEQEEKEIDYETKYIPETDTNLEVYLEEDPLPEKRVKKDYEDYDLMFLKSLTPFLRQLEPTRNLVVRSKMQDMLLNEIAAQNKNRNKL